MPLWRSYYGDHIAFHFVFMEFYTRWLIAPTLVGTLVWAVTQFESVSKRIVRRNGAAIMTDSRRLSLFPYFAVFMVVWSILFIEAWKRRNMQAHGVVISCNTGS